MHWKVMADSSRTVEDTSIPAIVPEMGAFSQERAWLKGKYNVPPLAKKGRVRGMAGSLLESSDNRAYKEAISVVSANILKSSCEILFPTPVDSKESNKSEVKQSCEKDRLKYSHPFSCPICDFVLNEPTTLPCGHTYCKKCLVKWRPSVCRLCKKKLFPGDFDSTKMNVIVSTLVKRWWSSELEAAAARAKGNQSVSIQEYAKALQSYSRALELAPHDHITLGNRSHVFHKLGRHEEALKDADDAIFRQPFWAKGYFRQATALRSLGRLEEAVVAFVICAILEDSSTAVTSEIEALLKLLLRRRRPSEEHVSKQRRRCDSTLGAGGPGSNPGGGGGSPRGSDGELDSPLHSDDSNCSTDASLALQGSPRIPGAEAKVNRLMDKCHSTVHALNAREGRQYVRAAGALSREDVECALCYRLFWQPTSAPCGHTFCRSCLDRWLDHSPTCPLCKTALDEFVADRDRSATLFLLHAMESLLPAETAERRTLHDEEVLADSLAGQDRHHEIPVFVCTLAFPTLPCPLHVFEPRYRLMVRRSMESGTREFGMCLPSAGESHGFTDVGVMLEVRDVRYFADGRSVVDAVGSRRFRCLQKGERDGYCTARVELLTDLAVPPDSMQELRELHDGVRALLERWWSGSMRADKQTRVVTFFGPMPAVETSYWTLPAGPSWLWWTVAILPVPRSLQLEILAMTSLKRRLRIVGNVLRRLVPAAGGAAEAATAARDS